MKIKKRDYGHFLNYILIVFVIIWLLSTINQFQNTIDEEGVKRLEEALRKAAVTCYSVEGQYPSSVEYLIDNYGIYIDVEKYHISYEVIGSNIQPEIRVYQR